MEQAEVIHDWVVDGPLGRGGMATVWRVHSRICHRLRGALKVTDLVVHESARDRFLREIDALARLRHHGVVRVLAAGETDDGRMYLVMELIEGEDLLHRLQRGKMEWEEAVFAFRVIADGLGHAHKVGIHHRDLKPANVMLTNDGSACLVDFGIALDLEKSRLTRAGTIPGTVTYMAPELLSVDSHDVAPGPADVYSMGQVLCEALTGRRCFDSPNGAPGLVRLVREKHSSGPLDPGDGIPNNVRNLVCKLTDPDPRRRPTMQQAVRLMDDVLSPDKVELEAIEEATRAMNLADLAEQSGWPFDSLTTEEADPDEEVTLVYKVLENLEERRAHDVEQELQSVADDPSLEEYSLAEPVLPDNALAEDEEVVQAFNSADILDELRADRARQMRSKIFLGMVGGLGLVGLAAVVGAIGLAWYLLN